MLTGDALLAAQSAMRIDLQQQFSVLICNLFICISIHKEAVELKSYGAVWQDGKQTI